MMHNDPVPIWALSIGVVVPLAAVLAACVCGCRKTVPKNELQGLAGMVKITNPEETLNHNHLSSDSGTSSAVGSGTAMVDITDANRRPSSTVNRSLPAIPSDSERLRLGGETIWENEANGDTSSELYATVGDNKQTGHSLVGSNRAPKRLSTLESQPDESKSSEHSSLSQLEDGFNHYACLKAEHPYDKLKKSEHPYAQVRPTSNGAAEGLPQNPGPSGRNIRAEETDENTNNDATLLPGNPIPPPRTRKSASHNSLVTMVASSPSDSVSDIPAATAIAGHIAANQELPYMTPPIPSTSNFSGDSQDSKGYTSISVREPLANIKAQTKASSHRSRAMELVDSHYATVSDDSDEMYAAIEEPGQVYTSGSETYAQIQPALPPPPPPPPEQVVSVEAAAGADAGSYPPQPPSVDSLKHVAQAHSRQASSSSAASSVANLGSPKPEKRQANSPLPPPPSGSPDMHTSGEKRSLLAPSDAVNLEEMYAKVIKKKRSPELDSSEGSSRTDTSSSIPLSLSDSQSHTSVSRESDRNSSVSSDLILDRDDSNSNSTPDRGERNLPARESGLEPDYEKVGASNSNGQGYIDPGYEVVHSHPARASNGVQQEHFVFGDDKSHTGSVPNLYNNNAYNQLNSSNDSNNNENRTDSDGFPRFGPSGDGRGSLTVFSDDTSEPNYESMPSEEAEHNYAGIRGASTGSEVDPNYEMVEHEDPNYESVNYFDANNDPPYERLHNEEVRDSDTDTVPGYEQVRHGNGVVPDGNRGAAQGTAADQGTEPGYEEVGRKQEGANSDTNTWSSESLDAGSELPPATRLPVLEPASVANNKAHLKLGEGHTT